jgi:hypothetical protein
MGVQPMANTKSCLKIIIKLFLSRFGGSPKQTLEIADFCDAA